MRALNSALWNRALVEQHRALGGWSIRSARPWYRVSVPAGSTSHASTVAMSPSRLNATATALVQVIPLERPRSAPPGSQGRIETGVRRLLGWR